MFLRTLKYWISYIILIFVLLFSSGCNKKGEKYDEELGDLEYFLSSLLNNPKLPKDDRERIRTTLTKCENNTLGLEPVLLQAYIVKFGGYDQLDMILTIVDPNKNVIGVGIKEECYDQNCCWKTIEEDYPVYIHCQSDLFNAVVIPLHIRTNCQKKDENVWAEYTNLDYDRMCRDYLLQLRSSKSTIVHSPLEEFWERTLPPVWVSMPDPNKLNAWVWLFDKAGKKSDSIKLINTVEDQNTE